MEAVQWAYDRGYAMATPDSVLDALDGRTETLLNMASEHCEIQFDSGTFYLRESLSQQPKLVGRDEYPRMLSGHAPDHFRGGGRDRHTGGAVDVEAKYLGPLHVRPWSASDAVLPIPCSLGESSVWIEDGPTEPVRFTRRPWRETFIL